MVVKVAHLLVHCLSMKPLQLTLTPLKALIIYQLSLKFSLKTLQANLQRQIIVTE